MNSPTKHKTGQHECCSDHDCATGLRNNYFKGKRLTADSFRVEQRYQLERRHLLNRAIHGWGVVYGFEVSNNALDCSGPNLLKIGPGLALDKCGRELIQTDALVDLAQLIVRDENGKPVDPQDVFAEAAAINEKVADDSERVRWMLSVHYAEQSTGRIKIEDQCQCEHDEWEHVCETVRYRLRRVELDECCVDFECELQCDCSSGACCGENKDNKQPEEPPKQPPKEQPKEPKAQIAQASLEHQRVVSTDKDPDSHTDKPLKRGGCRCLCDHLTHLKPECECADLCEIDEPCGEVRVDIWNGVDLACVEVVKDECDRWTFKNVEACGPRRLVKRNDLLFDLIRGCDLTYIKDYGWKNWHRKKDAIDFAAFADAFGGNTSHEKECVTQDFWVEFSRSVVRESVRQDCFVMTIIFSEADDKWWETLRVPIVRVETDNSDLIDRATIVVDGRWLRGTVKSDSSRFQSGAFRVEIEVRGDFIVDCVGQTVDANPQGLNKLPTGNHTPGGTFLSTFLVAAAPETSAEYKKEEGSKGVS